MILRKDYVKLIQEGRKEASQSQKKVIDRIFGKEEEEINLYHETGLKGLRIFDKYGTTGSSLLSIRVNAGDELHNKSFFLNPLFNWEIGKDSVGALCLVPTHKE